MSAQDGVTSRDWAAVLAECFESDLTELRLKAAQDATSCVSATVADVLRAQLEREPSAEVRAAVVASLGVTGRGQHVDALLGALEDEDERVRAAAAQALAGNLDKPQVVPRLVGLLEDPDQAVRQNVQAALRRLDPLQLTQTVRLMLEHPREPYKLAALYALERAYDARMSAMTWARDPARRPLLSLGPGHDLEILAVAKRLLAEPNVEVARRTRALVKQMDAAAVVEARQLLLELNLSQLAVPDREPTAATPAAVDRQAVRGMVNHPDPDMRLLRIRKILEERRTEHLPLLAERVKAETDQLVLRNLLEVLGKLGGASELPVVAGCLKDRNVAIRLAAVEALGSLGSAEALAALEPMLEDPHLRVRAAAASLACGAGNKDPATFLEGLVARGDRDSLLTAIVVIRRLPSAARFHDLLSKIHDGTKDPRVRSCAQEAETAMRQAGVVSERKVTGHFRWPKELLGGGAGGGGPARARLDRRTVLLGCVAVALGMLLTWLLLG